MLINSTDSLVNKVLGDVDLTQSQFIMIFIIQHIHQISIEGVNILKHTHSHLPTKQRMNRKNHHI